MAEKFNDGWEDAPDDGWSDVGQVSEPSAQAPKGRNYADRPWSEVGQDFLRMAPKVTQDLAGGLYTAAANPGATADVMQGAYQGLITRGGEQLDRISGGDPRVQPMRPEYQQFIQGQQGATPEQLGMADSMMGAYQDLLTEEGLKRRLSEESYLPLLDLAPAGQVIGKGKTVLSALAKKSGVPLAAGDFARETLGKVTSMGTRGIKKSVAGGKAIGEGRKLGAIELADKVMEKVRDFKQFEGNAFNVKRKALKTDPRKMEMGSVRDDFKEFLADEFDVGTHPDGTLNYEGSRVALDGSFKEVADELADYLNQFGDTVDIGQANNIRESIRSLYKDKMSEKANSLTVTFANKVKDKAIAVAPEYGDMLKNMAEAYDVLREFEKATGSTSISKANADMFLRKLVNSNKDGFEIRAHFVDEMAKATGMDMDGLITGYMSKKLTPQGLIGGATSTGGLALAGGALAGGVNPAIAAGFLTMMVAGSPKIVSNTLRALGASNRKVKQLMKWIPKQKSVGKHGLIGTYRASQERQKQQGEYDNLIQQGVQ